MDQVKHLKRKALHLMKNKNIMKIILIIFSISFSAVFGYSQNSHFADIYITPRRVNYGWADGGVLKFKLNKKSIKVPYKDRSYSMRV